MDVTVREIPDPVGIRSARTLPAAWYADTTHHERELHAVFRDEWLCIGDLVDMPDAGTWKAVVAGGLPVLVVRDREGELRAFLNVCRHRAAPLCATGDEGHGAALSCPYHAWLYRLDGSLARAQGVGDPEEFELGDFSLKPVGLATWRRWVFVHADARAPVPAFGPLADAVGGYPVEEMHLVLSESNERPFNWKVLLENYSENYHTPFVHPEIDNSNTHDYPMVMDGLVLYAWDRPLRPTTDAGVRMATLLPGEPGWDEIGRAPTAIPYDVGSYLTVWPNLMLNVFPDAALAMWVEPTSVNRTVVHRRLYVHPDASADSVAAQVDAQRLVHLQDIDICTAVQGTHDAGVDADGVLATVEERGVFFVHEHARAALGI
ncbi:MAG: aromatic ring-hydroxylating dioxygenase subunit alpha [Actinobacteria bacterium]|nr:aromatic ring-hydroxylating dioxygenase subunit alpha [Actinomycetota bacterium]